VSFRQGDWKGARVALLKALAVEPDRQEAERLLGLAYFYDGKPREATSSWQRLVERQPSNPEYHFLLGLCLLKAGEARDASEEFERAIGISPETYKPKVQDQLRRHALGS